MASKRDIERYERKLAKINLPRELDANCLGTVVTAKCVGYNEPITGTLLRVEHRTGAGIVGVTVYTRVTLCPDCAHTRSPNCQPLEDLDLVWLERSPERNTGGEQA